MALSKEQFTKLRSSGLSVDQIVKFESGDKPAMSGGKFNVPEAPVDRQNKMNQYKQEGAQAEAESKKANSALGMLGNFGKSFVGTIANSEVGLGKSIAKIIGAGDTKLTDAQKQSSDIELALLKRINEKKARGEDTTQLQQAYNRHKAGQGEVNNLVKEQFTLPTTGEVSGQLGGTALDVLTAGTYGKATKPMTTGSRFVQPTANLGTKVATGSGLPELGQVAAQKASGLLTGKGLGNIATGGAIGYASDVSQGLQGARGEDRTGAKAFIPGLGTALGTAIPAISETAQSVKNIRSGTNSTNKRYDTLIDLETKNSKVAKAFRAGDKKDIDVRKILSEYNILNGAVDSDGRISVELAKDNFNEFMKPFYAEVRSALEKEGRTLTAQEVSTYADDFIAQSRVLGSANTKLENEILADLSSLMKGKNSVPLTDLHDLKVFRAAQNNYTDTGANAVNKEVARFFKELVEKNTTSIDVETYNKELSKLYAVEDAIEALDRAIVKGGRAGKYFATTVGTLIGASSGNPFLALMGAEAGNQAQSSVLRNALGGNVNKELQPTSELLNALKPMATGKDAIPPVVMPKSRPAIEDLNLQSSESQTLTRQTNSPSTITPKTNAIPPTVLPIKKNISSGLGTVLPVKKNNVANAQTAIQRKPPVDVAKRETELRDYAKKINTDYDALTTKVEEKLSRAESWKEYADDEAEKIVNAVPNTVLAEAPLKSKERIIEKTLIEESGNLDNIKDIARNTIVPLDESARQKALTEMSKRTDIVKRKDQTPENFMGYEGTIFNIKTPDGQIIETQVVSPEMTFGKNLPEFSKSVLGEKLYNDIAKRTGLKPGLGHEYYEQWRLMSLADRLGKKGQELQKLSLDYYNALR